MKMKFYFEKDPLLQTHEELRENGVNLINEFCRINNFEPITDISFKRVKKSNHTGMYWYDEKRIEIIENRIIKPTKVPGFKWSYPGYKADKTIIGVLAHETGHHIENCLKMREGGFLGNMLNFIFLNKKISSYEPNKYEAFAETMRLFITNPDLLKIYSPDRYTTLIKYLKLKPVITHKWYEVLKYADEKYHNVIKKNRGNL